MDEVPATADRAATRLLPLIAMVGGSLILLDCLSQVAHAVAPWDPGSPRWRATALRLLFTQVTPVVLAAALLTLSLAGEKPGRWHWASRAFLAGAILVAVLGVAWWMAVPASLGGLDGVALLAQRRAVAQALVSAVALAAGFAAMAAIALRAGRSPAD